MVEDIIVRPEGCLYEPSSDASPNWNDMRCYMKLLNRGNCMEPECLRRGKEFHKKVQSDWDRTIKDGNLNIEHTISLLSHPSRAKHIKSGRLDMFVDDLGEFVGVIEIKSTDWDKIEPNNIRKLLTSHRRQIWNYISKYLDNDKIDVCPGIIYPRTPSSNELREYIEEYLNSYGIQVVWYYD